MVVAVVDVPRQISLWLAVPRRTEPTLWILWALVKAHDADRGVVPGHALEDGQTVRRRHHEVEHHEADVGLATERLEGIRTV
jgi:hypothetical protein